MKLVNHIISFLYDGYGYRRTSSESEVLTLHIEGCQRFGIDSRWRVVPYMLSLTEGPRWGLRPHTSTITFHYILAHMMNHHCQ